MSEFILRTFERNRVWVDDDHELCVSLQERIEGREGVWGATVLGMQASGQYDSLERAIEDAAKLNRLVAMWQSLRETVSMEAPA